MNINEFRASVVKKAIYGQLVPQDKTEGTSSELLLQILKEKNEKKEKKKIQAISMIKKNSKGIYYEHFEDGSLREVEEVFEIPDSWNFTPLSNVIELISGRDLTSKQYSEEVIGIPYLTGASNFSNSELIINRYTNEPAVIALKGDLLITVKGTIGEMAYLNLPEAHIARQIMAIRSEYISLPYIKIFLEYYVEKLKFKARSLIPGISRDDLLDALIPIPPLKEQSRIVKAVETCFTFAGLVEKRQILTKQFKIDLKAALLNEAIRGNLVTQNAGEESVVSKLKLLNIKNELLEDEPYNLPSGWVWAKLKTISKTIKAGGDKPKEVSSVKTDEFPFPIYANGAKNNGLYGYSKEAKITEPSLTVSARGTIGFSVVRREPYTPIVRLINIVPNDDLICLEYLKIVFDAIYTVGNGTSIPQLTVPQVKEKLIPVPPLQEQKRIIAVYEKLITNT
ncbi:TPA: restriction endonuclease subunit S [Bacillus cereus]|nr:restriction endonuclease subunit S [Bacillus cereus]HDR4879413.1 restriction endonuclease subunit S [Bacillus cereus]